MEKEKIYQDLFKEYKEEQMKGMHPDYEKWGIIEDRWNDDILPWIKKAVSLIEGK